MRPRYTVTKRYGHELGLSACFRQWRAESHCRHIHGYALAFEITYEGEHLDERGWLIDFGGLKKLKEQIKQTFDHRLLVAGDDPNISCFKELHTSDLANVLIMPDGVGAEAFARFVSGLAVQHLLETNRIYERVRVAAVTCAEHGANSATYYPQY